LEAIDAKADIHRANTARCGRMFAFRGFHADLPHFFLLKNLIFFDTSAIVPPSDSVIELQQQHEKIHGDTATAASQPPQH
jgi:hypothetical protein